MKKRKARVIWCIERPEIWSDGINRPVLWGLYKTKNIASQVCKNTDMVGQGMSIKYGKQRAVKFIEADRKG